MCEPTTPLKELYRLRQDITLILTSSIDNYLKYYLAIGVEQRINWVINQLKEGESCYDIKEKLNEDA